MLLCRCWRCLSASSYDACYKTDVFYHKKACIYTRHILMLVEVVAITEY